MCILQKIDKALNRMEKSGFEHTAYYRNLLSKRSAIVLGVEYTVADVSAEVVRAVFSLIPNTNLNFKGEKIKPRGKITLSRAGRDVIDLVNTLTEWELKAYKNGGNKACTAGLGASQKNLPCCTGQYRGYYIIFPLLLLYTALPKIITQPLPCPRCMRRTYGRLR